MVDLVVGSGQGGCRLGWEIAQSMDIPSAHCNLSEVDFAKLPIPLKDKFLLHCGGTGRDPELGEKYVKKHVAELKIFLSKYTYDAEKGSVMLVVGGGGGSGAGFLPHLLKYFVNLRKIDHIMLVYTLPEYSEGVPTKPNAIATLNRVISEYSTQIAITLIDNDYMANKYGHQGSESYWKHINTRVTNVFKKLWLLTNLEKGKNYYDMASGFKAIDLHDLQRAMFKTNGYVDVRELRLEGRLQKDTKIIHQVFSASSLIMEGLEESTAKSYVVILGIPDDYRGRDQVMRYVDGIFRVVGNILQTPDVIRVNYYNKKLKHVKLLVVMAGVTGNSKLKQLKVSYQKDMQILAKQTGLTVI